MMIEEDKNIEYSDDSSEETKRSIKNRLGRFFMITDIKDTALSPNLKKIKNEMYDVFCRTGIWKSEYINKIFRLYADKEQDIRITKLQLNFFSKYDLHIPDISETEKISVTQYVKTLKFLRHNLSPLLQQIKIFVSLAKTRASEQMKAENTDEIFSDFDRETEKAEEHALARQYLQQSMETVFSGSQEKYDWEWFVQQKNIITDTFSHNDYQDLMKFAVLGFHYFDRKNYVYDAFTSEQLHATKISFSSKSFHDTELSLYAFLKIIEHLDIKKHVFTI